MSGTAFRQQNEEVTQNGKRNLDRPVGVNEAKRRNQGESSQSKNEQGNEQKSVQSGVHEISVSIHRSQFMMEKLRCRAETKSNRLKFELEKFLMNQETLLVSMNSGASEEDKKLAEQLIGKRNIVSLANMLAMHSQQTEDVFEKKLWMTAIPSGQENSTVASQDERGEEGDLAEDGDVVEGVVEEVIDVMDEEKEEEGATPPNPLAEDTDEYED